MEGAPAPVSGFRFEMPPLDSHGTSGQRSIGLLSTRPGPFSPKYSGGLSPLYGQSFFGPKLAACEVPAAARAAAVLEPVLAPPTLETLARSWSLAGSTGLTWDKQFLAPDVVRTAACPAALPIHSVPTELSRRTSEAIGPKLALRAIFTDTLTGGSAELPSPADLRHVPLASWTRTHLEPLFLAGRRRGRAEALAHNPAEAAINGTGMRLVPCAPHVFRTALLAESSLSGGSRTVAKGTLEAIERGAAAMQLPGLPAGVLPNLNLFVRPLLAESALSPGRRTVATGSLEPIERGATEAQLPGLPAGTSARLTPASEGMWKIKAATPWTLSQPAPAQAMAATPHAVLLPAMRTAAVAPGLAVEPQSRRIEAQPIEVAGLVARAAGIAIDALERPAVPPPLRIPAIPAALPEAFEPRLVGSHSLTPHQAARPTAGARPAVPAVSTRPLALEPAMQNYAAPGDEIRLPAAEPIPPQMPAFVPQAAVARSADAPVAGHHAAPPRTLPEATASGFARKPFADVAPLTAPLQSRHLAPPAEPVQMVRIAFRQPAIPISGIEIPSSVGAVPLDLYVQRVRSTPKRECTWKPVPMRMLQPYGMPGVWPARFEQLVLQDWKRRYPSRLASITPAPISTGARVLPMSRHLPVLARIRQNAPQLAKGLAAAFFVGAILWIGAASKSVRTTVTADRHWLRDAVAKRATLVMDDNFGSGLNLWEGRKNWASSWSHSPDGFMRPGQLALYRPTLKMENYRLEFFAQIENKSVGWVFRAKDEQNYYAMKLSVTEPGPRPLVSVVRYPVLGGKRGKRVQIPLPIMMHNNTPYHVALDVKGTRFRAFVEDQEVDSWNDDRLRAGGVGFFSESGEHARLYWVKVSKNTDWLGRLCGMIAGAGKKDEAGMWDPADASGKLAVLDPASILDGARNADIKRGAPMLPLAAVWIGSL